MLLLGGIPYFYSKPLYWCVIYFISFALDAADGMVARLMNQCSDFGAFLDMITDRIGTLLLTMLIIDLNTPEKKYIWAWILIDIGSHWCRVYVSAKREQHHKERKSIFALLDLYYGNKILMFLCCTSAELFLLTVYLRNWGNEGEMRWLVESQFFWSVYYFTGLFYLLKCVIHVQQGIDSCVGIAQMDCDRINNKGDKLR